MKLETASSEPRFSAKNKKTREALCPYGRPVASDLTFRMPHTWCGRIFTARNRIFAAIGLDIPQVAADCRYGLKASRQSLSAGPRKVIWVT
jgi:hypothetical protein